MRMSAHVSADTQGVQKGVWDLLGAGGTDGYKPLHIGAENQAQVLSGVAGALNFEPSF